jgi:hypothetical protein
MAVIGLSRLAAINRVLRGTGYEEANTAPAAADTSEARDAEKVLDDVTNMVLAMGFPENTEVGKSYTPAGSGPEVGSGTSTANDNATWTASSKTITATGAFTGYTHGAGDTIYVYPVANTSAAIVEGYHPIASRPNVNTITLDSQPFDTDDTFGIAAIGPLRVTLGTDILKIRSSPGSPNAHRTLVANNTQTLYDADRGTSDLANDDTIYLDVTRDYTFENLSPPLKESIVAWARIEFQRWKKGLNDRDGFLLQELAVAEVMVSRNPTRTRQEVQSMNDFSALLSTLRQGQRDDRQ